MADKPVTRDAQDALIAWMRTASMKELREMLQNKEDRHLANDIFNAWRMRTQIRALREHRGWTQGELGRRCGMTQSAIARLETMYHPVDVQVRTLYRIAKALDVRLKIGFCGWLSLLIDIFNMGCRQRPDSFSEDTAFRS